jgi:hypothetical protein
MILRCLYTALFVLHAATAPAAGTDDNALSRQKRFVRSLFSEKRYFDAAAEAKRLRFEDTRSGAGPDYDFFIDINYFLGGQYRSVARSITGRPALPDFRSRILLSQSYLMLGMNARSLNAVRGIGYETVEAPLRYALLARKAEAYMECGLYRELLDEIAAAEPFMPERERVALLCGETERHAALARTSVPLAVALSVFMPGAGQIYAGKYISGIVSFIGVAALAGGAVLFYRGGRRDLSYTFIFFSSVFYLGNIYGAFNAAHAANEDRERGFKESFRRKCIPVYDPESEVRDNKVFHDE